ncbi:hypothetical protein [Streptomyces sp. 769]|uniref:hypothetical protein n=1 Tax=Streptomyces sp. 769 TaxID=1262452 RepID=UPI00057DFA1E|nr:hypothetical protein [Streptomyces sp. 769]AJC54017.1 hypothetical protein GZL_01417 [Streptomyces sp. 769]
MTDTEWATTEAFNWLAGSCAYTYREARSVAGYGSYRFQVWAEDALARIEHWDDEATADVDFEDLRAAVLAV